MNQPTFCPATMCPLFARDGSPWTGDKNAHCARTDCLWFHNGHCEGAMGAIEQIADADEGRSPFQVGPIAAKRDRAEPRTFDCPRAHECQWQVEAGDKLCPPRLALSLGLDPKLSAY